MAFLTRKDQVIFEKDEVLTQGGRPFTVFTPYRNAWLKKLEPFFLKSYPVEKYREHLAAPPAAAMPALADLGFQKTNLLERSALPPGMSGARTLLEGFQGAHDAVPRAARLPCAERHIVPVGAPALRHDFGARACARGRSSKQAAAPQAWLNELIWRDFYFMILHHYPARGRACVPPRVRRARVRQRREIVRSLVRRRAPAIRWSTRRCASSTRPVTCTTACAW